MDTSPGSACPNRVAPSPPEGAGRRAEVRRSVVLAWSPDPGLEVVSAGRCTGISLSLDEPNTLAPLATDAAGEVAITSDIGPVAYGASVQIVDLPTCAVSAVDLVPTP